MREENRVELINILGLVDLTLRSARPCPLLLRQIESVLPREDGRLGKVKGSSQTSEPLKDLPGVRSRPHTLPVHVALDSDDIIQGAPLAVSQTADYIHIVLAGTV